MNNELIEKVDALMNEWFNNNTEKSNRAWKKLLGDVK
jgi:hypothetical protein